MSACRVTCKHQSLLPLGDDHLEELRPGEDAVLPGMPETGVFTVLLDQGTEGRGSLLPEDLKLLQRGATLVFSEREKSPMLFKRLIQAVNEEGRDVVKWSSRG